MYHHVCRNVSTIDPYIKKNTFINFKNFPELFRKYLPQDVYIFDFQVFTMLV